MTQFKIKSSILFLLTALILVGCQRAEDAFNSPANESFSLTVRDMEGMETRSSVPASVGRVSYYIADSQGAILEMPYSSLAPDFSFIRVENLHNGDYRLLVLAESNNRNLASASVPVLKNSSDNWLVLNDEELGSLEKEYYYADHAFRVSNGTISNTDVKLTRILGKVAMQINTNSNFAADGVIRKVEVIPDADIVAYSKVNGNGSYSAPKPFARLDITKMREFTSLPLPEGSSFKGRIEITALTSDGSDAVSVYNFSTTITANALSTVTIDYKHPDDDNVSLYMPFSKYNTVNSSRILQDDEPKAIFYNSTLRSFKVNAPLQYGFDSDNKLFIRFYSAVGMSDVRLMWRDGAGVNLEFARFDSIPPFFEAHLEHPLSKKGGMMKTADGRIVRQEAIPNLRNAGLNLSIVCDDPYWKMIEVIIPAVNISFAARGGDPDAPNGAPNGRWMGIRPVHIREACALLTNVFYIASTNDFATMLQSHEGTFRGNSGENIPSATIINQYRRNRTLIVGLVTGALGLGGGSTWGVWQGGFFNHYNDSHTTWHELSHCIGYNHSSNLTYGPFAETYTRNLYTSMGKAGKLPVSYRSILNSANNPNRY